VKFGTAMSSKRERVKEAFADPLPYLRNNPYVALRAKAVRRLVPELAGKSLIDLGCGDGRISIPLVAETGELLLVDSSAGMLELARRSVPSGSAGRVSFRCVDLTDFEPQQRYDIVLCIGVLAHVPSPPATLRQIAQLVGPGGRAIIQFTDDASCLGRLTHHAGGMRGRLRNAAGYALNHMTLHSIAAELSDAGLRLVDTYRYVFVPGLRRLPAAMTRTIVRAVNCPLLSQRGGEVIATFLRG
jgi:2-polyprenyl-3-methyl-5-hydroxy-6-metoxy-1,4-benzoquinol methylase